MSDGLRAFTIAAEACGRAFLQLGAAFGRAGRFLFMDKRPGDVWRGPQGAPPRGWAPCRVNLVR